jgi:glucokinase
MAANQTGYWIGFDLGGTKMLAALFDQKFTIVNRKRRKTKPQDGAKPGVERIKETIYELLQDSKVKVENILGIGVGVPGMLDLDDGVILSAPNLGWRDVPLKEILKREFKCPIAIINDVDAGMFGEYGYGAAKNARCAVGIFPGTGIGGACIYEGQILRGRKNSCLEIGHIPVMSDGPLCGCGQRGCLESVASRLAISAAAALAAYRGEAPHLFEIAGTDLSNIRSGMLAASIEAGDKAIERIVREAAQWIGVGTAIAVNLLAPDVVVLGGGLVEAMPEIFREAVEETARNRALPVFKNTFRVVVAKLADDATVTGAATWAAAMTETTKPLKKQ